MWQRTGWETGGNTAGDKVKVTNSETNATPDTERQEIREVQAITQTRQKPCTEVDKY